MNVHDTGANAPGAETLSLVDALQVQYVRALDRKDMPGWAACFADPGSYVCMSREGVEQGLPIALMMDDNLARIADRVKYVTDVWVGTFEDYVCRHFVQRVECSAAASGLIAVESNFMVAYTSARGTSEMLVAGVYRDEVVVEGGVARFRSKTAVLDTVATPRYLVYPV